MASFTIVVNRRSHRVDAESDMPLLWVLRDRLNLTGTKYSCGAGLCGACTVLEGDRPVQGNFSDYRVLRIDQMPALDTMLLDSGARPGGFGEHAVPLVAPAVANALFAATGKRVRELPLTRDRILA